MYSIDCVFNKGTGGVRRFLELMNALINDGNDVYLYSADVTDYIKSNNLKGRSIIDDRDNNRTMVGLKAALGNNEIFTEIKNKKFERVVVFDIRAAFSLVVNNINNIYLFLRQDMYLYKKIQLDDKNVNVLKQAVLLKISEITEALCLKKAKKVVVQCMFDFNGLLDRHPLQRNELMNKTCVQINNINSAWIITRGECIQVPHKVYDLSFVGNFKDYRKGHDLLLSALKELTDEGIVIHAAIIGDGKHLDECKNQFANYSNIVFLGRLSNPIPVVESSRLLVVPSYADSCPNTVLEGLYYKVPVIGANRSGIPEILNDPDWLFEMDLTSIKEKIKVSLDKQKNCELQKKQMSRREELMFDWGKIMADIVTS